MEDRWELNRAEVNRLRIDIANVLEADNLRQQMGNN